MSKERKPFICTGAFKLYTGESKSRGLGDPPDPLVYRNRVLCVINIFCHCLLRYFVVGKITRCDSFTDWFVNHFLFWIYRYFVLVFATCSSGVVNIWQLSLPSPSKVLIATTDTKTTVAARNVFAFFISVTIINKIMLCCQKSLSEMEVAILTSVKRNVSFAPLEYC